jgi:hypothetical protein
MKLKFDTLFAASLVAIWLFKGLTARPLYRLFGSKGLIQKLLKVPGPEIKEERS